VEIRRKKEKRKVSGKFSFTRKHLAIPYAVFLVVFVIVPLFIVAVYAFSAQDGSGFTFNNFAEAWREQHMFWVLLDSFLFAFLTTVICLLIAYPVALILSNPKFNRTYVTVLLFIVPMWINFMLRTYAMLTIFEVLGIELSYMTGLIGTVYDFLPFMILPIYTTLIGLDKSLPEASADVGATPLRTFFKVTLPLSVPGIISGVLMVFMPTISSFAIVEILGRDIVLFGTKINGMFLTGGVRNVGAAMSLVMLLLVGISVFAANKFAKKGAGVKEIKGGSW